MPTISGCFDDGARDDGVFVVGDMVGTFVGGGDGIIAVGGGGGVGPVGRSVTETVEGIAEGELKLMSSVGAAEA